MSNIFFGNIPNIGDLFINKILLEYELEPVIFVCKDSYNNFFLCICDDFIDTNRSWIVVKLTVQDLLDVIKDRITLLFAFKKSDNKTIVIDYCSDKNTYDYHMIDFSDIDENELPYEDQYLNEKENLYDYIDYLKSFIISYEFQDDFNYLDTISINVNNNQEDNFSIGKEYDPVKNDGTLEKPNEVNIQSNSKLLVAA